MRQVRYYYISLLSIAKLHKYYISLVGLDQYYNFIVTLDAFCLHWYKFDRR